MYARVVPSGGGPIFDELEGLLNPTPEELANEPQGTKVGQLNDDGTYSRRPENDIVRDAMDKVLEEYTESARRQVVARGSLKAMGFQIVENTKDQTLFEELGGTIVEHQSRELPGWFT